VHAGNSPTRCTASLWKRSSHGAAGSQPGRKGEPPPRRFPSNFARPRNFARGLTRRGAARSVAGSQLRARRHRYALSSALQTWENPVIVDAGAIAAAIAEAHPAERNHAAELAEDLAQAARSCRVPASTILAYVRDSPHWAETERRTSKRISSADFVRWCGDRKIVFGESIAEEGAN
jgi:hypothetical protein